MEALRGTHRASRHFGGPETPEPPNIPSSFIRAAWMLQPPAPVSPPRPPAVTSTPNAEESDQQPASRDLQTRTLPAAPPGLASRLRTQLALSSALWRPTRRLKRLTQEGRGSLHKTQRRDG